MAKKPYPPKGSASKAGYAAKNLIPKMMGKAKSIKVDPMDYLGKPSPKRAAGPSKIIKPFKGPKINRDDDLRDMFPRKKRTPTKPRGNPNAKYRIVPAKKKK